MTIRQNPNGVGEILGFFKVGEARMNPTKSDEPLLTGYVLNK